MGNDQSHLQGIDIEDKAIEVADFWNQHSANICKSRQSLLTVFIGELFVSGPLWTINTPLEKFSKNLMIYRHPCILKYISSWSKSSKFYLVVEHVKPLSHVYSSLSILQICVGLHSVLKALCFLHEKASTSHNNISLASVYVTDDGNWKVGGMEFSCKYSELTKDYLNKSRANRYSPAIDPNEEDHIQKSDVSKDFIDTYAFFMLAHELLKSEKSDDIPSLSNFRSICKDCMENTDIHKRLKLSELLDHPFFNHHFIRIHSCLVELPLKSDEEKIEFFSKLPNALRKFDENLVANQLSHLLLSRMVLLNPVAQSEVLPEILCFRQEDDELNNTSKPFFSQEIFKKNIVPRLLEIFRVRDAQIRSILLKHFANYVHAFSENEMQTSILPELLVGIKDTNDALVSATLKALSVLVLILGADIVIGGKRAKLFTNGKPTSQNLKTKKTLENSFIAEQTTVESVNTYPIDPVMIRNLPERQRPDGEDFTSTDEIEQSVDGELEWEDWDINDNHTSNARIMNAPLENNIHIGDNQSDMNTETVTQLSGESNSISSEVKKINIQDISDLDIKNQTIRTTEDEIDFFLDMEPEIKTSSKFLISSENQQINSSHESNQMEKLCFTSSNNEQEDGWGEEDWD